MTRFSFTNRDRVPNSRAQSARRPPNQKIVIAGCGPGSADYVTPAVRRAIAHADALIGAQRLLDIFPEIRAERVVVGTEIENVLNQIAAWGNRRVVVLVSGDPGLCSLAKSVLRRFGTTACRVIPGISAIQAAFAAAGVDWLDARIVSAHRGTPDVEPAALAGADKIAVLAGNNAARPWLVELAAVLGSDYQGIVCKDLTLPTESVRPLHPAQLRTIKLRERSILLFIRREAMQ